MNIPLLLYPFIALFSVWIMVLYPFIALFGVCIVILYLILSNSSSRTSLQKYAPLEWSAYFDQEDDVCIPDSNDVSDHFIWLFHCLLKLLFRPFYENIIFNDLCCFRYFTCIWQEQKGQLSFVYMEVVILGMFDSCCIST